MSDAVTVMYAGRIVETAPTDDLYADPRHPYTDCLLRSITEVGTERTSLALTGELPDPRNPPVGCRFHPRCPVGPNTQPDRTICLESDPQLTSSANPHHAACHFAARAPAVKSEHIGTTEDTRASRFVHASTPPAW
jgi:peptide/nickel transport system ATP-binding protein